MGTTLLETLGKDTVKSQSEALLEIYKRLRPGDPPTLESSKNLFNGMFYSIHGATTSPGSPAEVQQRSCTE